MVTNYRRGYNFEKRVVKCLSVLFDSFLAEYPQMRYIIVESRRSRGLADILCGLRCSGRFLWFGVQCKKVAPSGKFVNSLCSRASSEHGMVLFFAFSYNRKVAFLPNLEGYIQSWLENEQ